VQRRMEEEEDVAFEVFGRMPVQQEEEVEEGQRRKSRKSWKTAGGYLNGTVHNKIVVKVK